jgi:hypothetical protein
MLTRVYLYHILGQGTGTNSDEVSGPRSPTSSTCNITFKDNLLLIYEGQSVEAFFRAPQAISAIASAGERIGLGCKNGEVLADWLD